MNPIHLEKKILNISTDRNITLPLNFYEMLKIESEVECILTTNAIIIQPVMPATDDTFTLDILKDLIAEGYSGESLLLEFPKRQQSIRASISKLHQEADAISSGEISSISTEELFGDL